HGVETPLQKWQADGTTDGLVYDRTPDGSLVVLPVQLFHKGTYVIDRRPDGSVVPYVAGAKYPPRKTADGEIVLAVDPTGVPQWEQYEVTERKGTAPDRRLVNRTPLMTWPGNSLIAERRPDGSVTLASPPEAFPYLVLHPRDQV